MEYKKDEVKHWLQCIVSLHQFLNLFICLFVSLSSVAAFLKFLFCSSASLFHIMIPGGMKGCRW